MPATSTTCHLRSATAASVFIENVFCIGSVPKTLETRQGLIFGGALGVKVFHHDMMRPLARGSAERKALGAYYTPGALVEAALAWLPRPERVADLACGDGAWLAAAGRRWPQAALYGVDIDAEAAAAARRRVPGAAIEVADGTRWRGGVDCVVGNPPWGAGRIGNVRRGAESVSAFVDAAVENLAPGGRLCLLVPAAWLEVA